MTYNLWLIIYDLFLRMWFGRWRRMFPEILIFPGINSSLILTHITVLDMQHLVVTFDLTMVAPLQGGDWIRKLLNSDWINEPKFPSTGSCWTQMVLLVLLVSLFLFFSRFQKRNFWILWIFMSSRIYMFKRSISGGIFWLYRVTKMEAAANYVCHMSDDFGSRPLNQTVLPNTVSVGIIK